MTRQEEVHKAILETELTTEEEIQAIWEKKKAKYMTQGNRLNDPDKQPLHEFTAKATPDVLKTVEMIKQALNNSSFGNPLMIHKPTFKIK